MCAICNSGLSSSGHWSSDPGVVGHKDLGFYRRGVLTVKGKVSMLQDRGSKAITREGFKVGKDLRDLLVS